MRKTIIILLAIVALWVLWSLSDRAPATTVAALSLDVTENVGSDTQCARNIVGIQPYMVPQDYITEQRFKDKIDGYFQKASEAGYFRSNTVVLLPEYLGTWLVVADEKESVAGSSTVTGAMTTMIGSNPLRFIRHFLITTRERDRMAATIFRMKAVKMAEIYARVFRLLAERYRVTIIAGSIVLPGPKAKNGTILVDHSSPLYNTSFTFYPNGEIDAKAIRKSFPIRSELTFVQPSPITELPVLDLSIGKTVTLVCADSWYPESYSRVKDLEAEVILVSSYCAGNQSMAERWGGYDGGSMPADVSDTDVASITEREAWLKYALPGRIARSGARIGVNVFLRGKLWDLGTDGQPLIVIDGKLLSVIPSDRAGIWNVCF